MHSPALPCQARPVRGTVYKENKEKSVAWLDRFPSVFQLFPVVRAWLMRLLHLIQKHILTVGWWGADMVKRPLLPKPHGPERASHRCYIRLLSKLCG